MGNNMGVQMGNNKLFLAPSRLCGNVADREQNILDAVSLPVNRLAFKRILCPGWQSDEGGQTRQIP
jgi:hypothetical protein